MCDGGSPENSPPGTSIVNMTRKAYYAKGQNSGRDAAPSISTPHIFEDIADVVYPYPADD